MLRKKSWIIVLILIVAFISILYLRDTPVLIDYGESALFTREEMNDAISIIKGEFRNGEFKYSTLHQVTYQGDTASEKLAENYHHDKAMAFKINFHSPKSDRKALALNPDKEYTGYQILIYLDETGSWVIDYMGCGFG